MVAFLHVSSFFLFFFFCFLRKFSLPHDRNLLPQNAVLFILMTPGCVLFLKPRFGPAVTYLVRFTPEADPTSSVQIISSSNYVNETHNNNSRQETQRKFPFIEFDMCI